ncbi:uncharacterized protein C2845_PM01G31340 [Panicum miliaceum]|uniref:Bifunctional inhibitor/plant lipid transfer protein/seed storage helical domain-containing protein n=1 Tax=Panicum miliaceum TaxID=4540 RepID=A0A3L6TR26_PANMI|nr:uncharacterized protein C2845_PM01G31340 [Panicum miliaceum]
MPGGALLPTPYPASVQSSAPELPPPHFFSKKSLPLPVSHQCHHHRLPPPHRIHAARAAVADGRRLPPRGHAPPLLPAPAPALLPPRRGLRGPRSPPPPAAGEEPARPQPLLALDALRRSVLDSLTALKRPALALPAAASAGGRVGGSAFSSRSSSPPSYEYSAPAPRGGYTSAPFYSPSPFVCFGPAVGIGFGGSGFLVALMGFAAFLYLAGFMSDSSGNGSVLTETQKTTVLKLQVGLLGMARSFQKELDQIAEKADTSTPAGLSYVLTETTLALLRHPDCCISAYSTADVKRSTDDGEKRFNQLSIEERGKFDEETLVNVNSIKRNKAGSQRSSGFSNEYIVITVLVAGEGVHKLPAINSSNDLKTALQKLGSIPSSKILEVANPSKKNGSECGAVLAPPGRGAGRAASAQSSGSGSGGDCTSALVSLSPCMDYISGNGTSAPSASCCSQLKAVVQSKPQCLCAAIGGVEIDRSRALGLPAACNVQTPPASQCNAGSSDGGSKATPSLPSGAAALRGPAGLVLGLAVVAVCAAA